MIRRTAITALLVLSATACTSVETGSSGIATPDTSTSSSATASSDGGGVRTSAWFRDQMDGRQKNWLLPVTSGAEETTLGPISPSSTAYTLLAECEGNGSVRIDTDPAEKPEKVRCGVPTLGVVLVDRRGYQTVTITPSDGVKKWTIAVLDGTHSA
ncbi:hypothetical protein [Streptomyces sp. NPDC059639]|uniref:hypothetical protein n=1 Tax=Streptomyces sp. NPDC059639 TaxID=3346891 RepID=UPI0036C9A79C